MEVLAVIPARGNSKQIPLKNMSILNSHPLIYWTIRAAKKSKVVTKILVSTEDSRIAAFAKNQGAEVPYIRPKVLTGDTVHSVYTVLHALRWLAFNEKYKPDAVIMLLPTSPLRRFYDIDDAFQIFIDKKAKSVIGICPCPPLESTRYMRHSKLHHTTDVEEVNFQRQDVKQTYVVNGALFIISPDILKQHGTFHVEDAMGYVMPYWRSIDVNTLEDLKIAEKLMRHG